MSHDKLHLFTPFLDGEMLDLNVSHTWCGPTFINHVQGSKIIDEHAGWARPKGIKGLQDIAKIFDDLSASDCRVEFGFGQAGGNKGLYLTLPRNGGAAEEHNQSSNGSTGTEFGGMGCVKAANEFVALN